jgi:hypothetical protein
MTNTGYKMKINTKSATVPTTMGFALKFFLFFSTSLAWLPSCSYRFTNQNIQIPVHIQSIAVEGIFDTSREVLPRHHLWSALQQAFARDGHLTVTSTRSADALLRIHLDSAGTGPTGSGETTKPLFDDPLRDTPDSFRNLRKAGEYTTHEVVRLSVHVEIIDLHKKTTLLKKSYSSQASFRSMRTEDFIQAKSQYLAYEESLEQKVKEMSESIAESIVRDFIVKR